MNETVAIAAQLMRASNISALVVKDVVRTEGNTAVGMFTERDVVRAIAEHGAAGVNMKVSQLISVQQLVSCSSTDTLEHVRHLMNKNHIRHLPVIDNYSLIGVISIRDISTAFDEEAQRPAQPCSRLTPRLKRRIAACVIAIPDRRLPGGHLPGVTASCPLKQAQEGARLSRAEETVQGQT